MRSWNKSKNFSSGEFFKLFIFILPMAAAIMCLWAGAFDSVQLLWTAVSSLKWQIYGRNSKLLVLFKFCIPPVLWTLPPFFAERLNKLFAPWLLLLCVKVLPHITVPAQLTDNWHLQHYLSIFLLFIPTVPPLEMKLWNVKQQRSSRKGIREKVGGTWEMKWKFSYPRHYTSCYKSW